MGFAPVALRPHPNNFMCILSVWITSPETYLAIVDQGISIVIKRESIELIGVPNREHHFFGVKLMSSE